MVAENSPIIHDLKFNLWTKPNSLCDQSQHSLSIFSSSEFPTKCQNIDSLTKAQADDEEHSRIEIHIAVTKRFTVHNVFNCMTRNISIALSSQECRRMASSMTDTLRLSKISS
uniref:Uncharacterized protein n=1 Tax=Glossina brevipalpis TaxID=37001 RepID=A0A1A9WND0_9MUSC